MFTTVTNACGHTRLPGFKKVRGKAANTARGFGEGGGMLKVLVVIICAVPQAPEALPSGCELQNPSGLLMECEEEVAYFHAKEPVLISFSPFPGEIISERTGRAKRSTVP